MAIGVHRENELFVIGSLGSTSIPVFCYTVIDELQLHFESQVASTITERKPGKSR
jgi:hypothetical protein